MEPRTRLRSGEPRAAVSCSMSPGHLSGHSHWAIDATAIATAVRTLLFASARPRGNAALIAALSTSGTSGATKFSSDASQCFWMY